MELAQPEPGDERRDAVELERLEAPGEMNRGHSVLLTGKAAEQVGGTLGRAARDGVGLVRRSQKATYKLVPSDDLRKGMEKGVLRAAKARNGSDVSLLVNDVKTGRIAGHQQLVKSKPKATQALGPVAWQAMALATQQHYLVEITEKLDGLQAGIDEVLARMDDDRLGTLRHLGEKAIDARRAIEATGDLSAARRTELRTDANEAKKQWHRIETTTERKVRDYERGSASADEAEQAFVMLLRATQTLARCSESLIALPHESAADLDHTLGEEYDRLDPALPKMRELAGQLLRASKRWNDEEQARFEYESANILGRGLVRTLRKAPPEAKQRSLEDMLAWECGRVASERLAAPTALLVEASGDGSVRIGVDSVEGQSGPGRAATHPDDA